MNSPIRFANRLALPSVPPHPPWIISFSLDAQMRCVSLNAVIAGIAGKQGGVKSKHLTFELQRKDDFGHGLASEQEQKTPNAQHPTSKPACIVTGL